MNDQYFEVRGRSRFLRRYIILVSRIGMIFFIAMSIFFVVDLPDAPERTFLVSMLLLVVAICAIASEFFAHEERRDASSMTVNNEGIVLRNDYIDRLRGRASKIDWNDVERIDSYSSPSDGGEESGFMVIRTKNGTPVGTGLKSSEDLKQVLELAPSNVERVIH